MKITVLAALALSTFACAACGGGAESAREDAPALRLEAAAPEAEGAPAPPPLAIPAGAPKVAFLSDSIGAGLHLAKHQAFPSVLQRELAREGRSFELVDSSESGRTSAGGLAALDWVLRSEPDLLVLALGGNDGLRGIDLGAVEDNLRATIEKARAAGVRVLLLGVRLPPNYGEYAERFEAIYPRLAAELELDFVPFFMEGVGGVADHNLADGLHPTAAGHERLAANVAPKLAAVLDALAAR